MCVCVCVCTSPTGNQVLVTTWDYSSTLQDVEKPSWAHWALVNGCALQDCWASSFQECNISPKREGTSRLQLHATAWWAPWFVGFVWWTSYQSKTRKPGSSFLPTAFSCQFTVQVHKYAIILLLTVGDSLLVPTCSNLSKCFSWPFGSQWHFSEKGSQRIPNQAAFAPLLVGKTVICKADLLIWYHLIVSIPPKHVVCTCGYWRDHSNSECCTGPPKPRRPGNLWKIASLQDQKLYNI